MREPHTLRGKDATSESTSLVSGGDGVFARRGGLVRADVINFSGLSTDNFSNPAEAPIPNGYAGFNWNNFSSLNTHNDPTATPSGYSFADTDSASPSVAFNLFGQPASISAATAFSFYGAFFTAAWRDGLKIDVTGYRDNQLVYEKKFTVDSTGPTFEAFDFLNIDTLDFSTTFTGETANTMEPSRLCPRGAEKPPAGHAIRHRRPDLHPRQRRPGRRRRRRGRPREFRPGAGRPRPLGRRRRRRESRRRAKAPAHGRLTRISPSPSAGRALH